MARYSNGESVLSRLARLFDAFGPETRSSTVSELSERTGIPLPTVSRMVAELVERGWLQRDAERRVWIGVRMWEMVSRAAPMRELSRTAMPFMTELHARIGQHVHLGVREGHEVLIVEQLSAPIAVRSLISTASRLPLHASAPGLVLLAHASADVQESVLAEPLRGYTPHTVTDPRALRMVLSRVRRAGAAYCPGLIDPIATSIAVPLRAADGQVMASLSVVLPNTEAAMAVMPAVRAAGLRICRALADRRVSELAVLTEDPRPLRTGTL
ncbi:IclR family transcriptional regulator [Nocardia sp. alder85J]|uniref:IclR family transcriptional regulator n=1 Tax=Nocardia sp. alder85J TaxID=2862949 RepID=UPI001CD19F7A|nr:IclR family transcriptional regulator [Nocardia sp. alder85J]MCX4098142.1 IclR family transcriptional regulator [Nocardia sp. alder85J]